MMPRYAALSLGLALALCAVQAHAAETPADLVCGRCAAPSRYKSCYDPCEPVGPVRRLWRSLFRTPCPPRVAPAIVVAPAPVYAPAPPMVELGRPGVPPAADVPPPPSPPGPFTGSSMRTPAAPPSDLRFERMASRSSAGGYTARAAAPEKVRVLLINADRTSLRHRLLTDDQGGLTADLSTGDWLIYTQNDEGALTFRGTVKARDGQPTRVNLRR